MVGQVLIRDACPPNVAALGPRKAEAALANAMPDQAERVLWDARGKNSSYCRQLQRVFGEREEWHASLD